MGQHLSVQQSIEVCARRRQPVGHSGGGQFRHGPCVGVGRFRSSGRRHCTMRAVLLNFGAGEGSTWRGGWIGSGWSRPGTKGGGNSGLWPRTGSPFPRSARCHMTGRPRFRSEGRPPWRSVPRIMRWSATCESPAEAPRSVASTGGEREGNGSRRFAHCLRSEPRTCTFK